MYKAPYQGVANQLAEYGRYGDSQLVHMNPIEVQMLASLSPTGQLTRNPQTGQPEAFLPFLAPLLGSFLGSSLLTGAGAGILGAAGLSSAAAGAIGSGLATAAVTGDLEQGILSGITGFGLGQAFGAAGDALSKAGVDTATQAATDAATQAAQTITPTGVGDISLGTGMGAGPSMGPMATAPMESFLPMSDRLDLLSQGLQAPLSSTGTTAAAVPTARDLTATQRLSAPFQEPGAFLKQLSSPGTFLPAYVGETSRMAREQELMGRGSMREYEEQQAAERRKTLGQMGNVFNQVRQAYPRVGYAEGGMVEKYFDGGGIEDQIRQAAIDQLYGVSLPTAQNVQLGLRGQYVQTPPTASYSALDVGGEGYLPGVSPEFEYFSRTPPPGTSPGPINPPQGPPAGPGMDMDRLGYGGIDLGQYLSNFANIQNRPAFDPNAFSSFIDQSLAQRFDPLQERIREMETQSLLQREFNPFRNELARLQTENYLAQQFAPLQQSIGNLGAQYAALNAGLATRPTSQAPINVSVPVNLGGLGDALQGINQNLEGLYDPNNFFLSNINERLAGIENRPTPEFDYSRIPTPSFDFSTIEQRLAAIENRPIPEFDYSRIPTPSFDFSTIEQRLAGIENRPTPEFDYSRIPQYTPFDLSPLENRLAAIESRSQPEFDYSRIPVPSFDFSPIEQRLAAIESRPQPQFDYSRIPQIDLSGLESRLGGLESRIGSIQTPAYTPFEFDYSRIPRVDLSGLESRLGGLESRVGNIQIPAYTPFEFDYNRLSGLESRLGGLEQGLGSIRSSIPSAPDLSGIYGQLGTLQSQLGSLSSSIPAAPDLSGIYNRFGELESRIGNIQIPAYTPFEFDYNRISGLESRLGGLEQGLGSIRSSIPAAPDLSGIYGQLGGLQSQLGSLSSSIPAAPDLSGLYNRFGELESQLGSLRSSIPSAPDLSGIYGQLGGLQSQLGSLSSSIPAAPDLSGIYSQLGTLQSQIGSIAPTNIDPVLQRLSGLEALLANQSNYYNPYQYQYGAYFAEGGATSDAIAQPSMNQGDPQQLVAMTVAAIRGEIENADEVIQAFVDTYGSENFMQLRNQVLREIVPNAQTEGMVEGNGGGQDDLVEGMIGSQRPVAVSPGEYIIPADAVALAGGGYSGDGAKFFDSLVDDIRSKTMGTTEQVKPYREMAE
jgi:hypothetical protein